MNLPAVQETWVGSLGREDPLEKEMHRLNGYELEQALGVADGQGSLACCSPWGRKESDMTGRLN